ncbi:hypothetical protein [Nocardioides pinisoli]|uniref:Uncharacterized protein n=1 Tax=Nocardioides pinisoli TaxID=2950279 RepID=A0ABT1KY93_9ACTN|nr:hypothetical protein [Nocardioides pinisoli]MCP3422734.1 hypothetical protein [Nocardioides pinisoli]
MARSLEVVIGDGWAEFAGWGSRSLYLELRGRPPVFNTRSRRWVAQQHTARDLIALAESRGYAVTIAAAQSVDVAAAAGDEPEPAPPEQEPGLW